MDKPTIIFLPALMCDEYLYQYQISALQKSYNIITPIIKDYSNIEAAAEYIFSIAPKKFSLIGTSMGGYIAMQMAYMQPNRINKLCIIASKIEPDTPKQIAVRKITIEEVKHHNKLVPTNSYLDTMFYSEKSNINLYHEMKTRMNNLGVECFYNQQELILTKPNLLGKLKNFIKPTLVISGEEDSITPVNLGQQIANEIPNSQFIALPQCGHFIPLERPIAVNALLQYFLQANLV